MAVIPRKLAGKRTAYWIVFRVDGRQVWEHAGHDERAAERLERRRRAEVASGTYTKARFGSGTSVATFAREWIRRRQTRNAKVEAAFLEAYVLKQEAFATALVSELSPKHIHEMVRVLKASVSATTGRPLSNKTVANIYGAVRTMLQDAVVEELLVANPCQLRKGMLRRKGGKPRDPYELEEAALLISHPDVAIEARVWNAIGVLGGMREGEIAGLRFVDWDEAPEPLGCLTVERQYDGRLLKTEEGAHEHTRKVPVHPLLAQMLHWWKSEGFAAVFLRAPTGHDPIVPRSSRGAGHLRPHTKSTGYKMFRRACEAAGVRNRTLHSTRHTFMSLARRAGARKEVVELVTHNASGTIVDVYTHWEWEQLCEAVSCIRLTRPSLPSLMSTPDGDVDSVVDRDSESLENMPDRGGGAGNRSRGRTHRSPGIPGTSGHGPPLLAPGEDARKSLMGERVGAGVDPSQRLSPGLAKAAVGLAALTATDADEQALAFDRAEGEKR